MSGLKLFEIGREFSNLSDIANDEEFDSDTGEFVNRDEDLKELFESINSKLSEKIDNTMYIVKELIVESDALKKEAKRLSERAKTRDNKANLLKSLIKDAILSSGSKKIKTEKFNFSIRESKSVYVKDIDVLPRKYIRLKKEADKNLIKDELISGKEIDGCRIEINSSITIK